MADWAEPVGSVSTRIELAAKYGGSPYSGGIVPSNSTPNIFLFTDPAEGIKYGYNRDGPSPSGDAFYYTGKGTTGDQLLAGANGSVLSHMGHKRALRL